MLDYRDPVRRLAIQSLRELMVALEEDYTGNTGPQEKLQQPPWSRKPNLRFTKVSSFFSKP